MSAQAVIPLEQVSAALNAGEADNIAFLILVGDYLYGLTTSNPAKLVKIKRNDFATRTVITFTVGHGNAAGLVYAPSTNRIYALFGSTGGIISEIHPDTLVVTDKINIAGVFVAAAADCLATDNTYLFVLWDTEGIELPSRIVRYVLADLRDDNSTPLDLTVCGDSLKYAGGYLYVVSLLNPLPKLQKINATNFGAAITGKDFPAGTTQVGIDLMAVTGDYVFVSFAGVIGKLWRFAKSDLAVTEIATNLSAANVALASDGNHAFQMSNDGKVARVAQTDLTQNTYSLATNYLRTLVTDGSYLYGCTLTTSTTVYRFLITQSAVPGSTLWSSVMGGGGNDYWNAVACDSDGNVIAVGSINGYIIINKYSSAGVMMWSKQLGAGYCSGVVCDSSDNIFVTGAYLGNGDFGGGVLPGQGYSDIFVVKYSPTGAHIWSKGFVGSAEDAGKAIAVDSSGDVYVTGFFYAAVNFGGISLTSAGGSDIFLVKVQGSDGATLWAKRFGDAQDVQNDLGSGVAVDRDGNVFLTGQFGNSINFGGDALTSAGQDIFLAKFNSLGTHIWSKRFGGVSRDNGYAVATDPTTGAVVIVGWFRATINFGGANITSNGLDDIFVAKLDSSGGHLWSKGLGDYAPDVAYGVAVDNSGNIYVTGRFAGVLNCGNGVTTPEQPLDCFVVKFSSAGTAIWVRYWGGESTDEGRGITLDRSVEPNDILVCGYWYPRGIVDFGDGIIRQGTDGDAFLVKLKG